MARIIICLGMALLLGLASRGTAADAPAAPAGDAPAQAPAHPADDEAGKLAGEAALEALPELLGHARYRVREAAQKRLQELLASEPEKVAELCYAAYSKHADPEVRMRARAVLLDYVVRSQGSRVRGFVGIGLMLHVFFDKGGEVRFGVRVTQVVPGTPAAKAGFQVGDMITAVDDVSVADKDGDQRFMDIVGNKGAGNQVVLTYRRGDKEQKVELVLAARPAAIGDAERALDPEKLFREFLRTRAEEAAKP